MAPISGMTPIKGEHGRLRVGSNENQAEIPWAGEFDVEITNDKSEVGPFIGDGNKYILGGGRLATFSIKGTIPKGHSAAVRMLRRKTNGTITTEPLAIELEAFGGDWFKFSNPFFEKYKSSLKGNGSHEFECSGSGIVVDGDSIDDTEDTP